MRDWTGAQQVQKSSWKEEPMLVLSRKPGERVNIGENVVVVITRVAGNRVTIGIEAPDDVRIVRGELPQQGDNVSRLESEKD